MYVQNIQPILGALVAHPRGLTRTVFDRPNIGIVGLNRTPGVDYVRVLYVRVVPRVGRGILNFVGRGESEFT
jgi:hypothetical protein